MIGLILGLFIFPPWGLLIGFALGAMYDNGVFQRWQSDFGTSDTGRSSSSGHTSTQQVFFDTSFAVMGYIAKADGRVSQQEIDIAESVMAQMGLVGELRRRAISMFNQGKNHPMFCREALARFRRVAWFQPGLIRMFLEIQMQIATATGRLSLASQEALRFVFQSLGIPNMAFEEYLRQFSSAYQQQSHGYSQSGYTGGAGSSLHIGDAYQTLGVTKESSDDDVKKAYRRLMSKNHPDRLIAKGVPPEMIKIATQKTQTIKQAYDRIKSVRNMA